MKAIPKDKQIAVHAMISAPIDETNVQSDIIRRVFDNEECITRKGTYLGYVEDMAVKATIFYNNVFFTLINKNEADKGIFAGTYPISYHRRRVQGYIYWELFPVYL